MPINTDLLEKEIAQAEKLVEDLKSKKQYIDMFNKLTALVTSNPKEVAVNQLRMDLCAEIIKNVDDLDRRITASR